ncbi:MAG: type II secretion system F family protein, partial [Oscillospiraceae bacterium]|nr:type II secretion system F family protein [Oscillospiraceae bacterium]
NMSDICDNEASAAIKRALKVLEPIMILIMAAVILTVVLSVMLPIYDMYSGIGAMGRI